RIAASHLVLDMAREGVDLAIRDIPSGKAPPGSIRLVGERLCPVATPAYLDGAKAPIAAPEDLRGHTLLMLHDPQGRWPWLTWAAWFEAKGLPDLTPAGTLTYDQYDQVVNAALHGQGVALGRLSIVDSFVKEGLLVPLFGKRMPVPRALHAVYAPGAQARPEAQAFVAWLKKEIG
ncbi:MAG: LysR substrate-binding domain-containing protein, partial [Burkholderiales bacterium]